MTSKDPAESVGEPSGQYEIELVGGHADGRTFTLPNLPAVWRVLAPIQTVGVYQAEAEGTLGPDEPLLVADYHIELSRFSGKPVKTVEGRYVYRSGRRPPILEGDPPFVDDYPRATNWQDLGDGLWRADEQQPMWRDSVLFVLLHNVGACRRLMVAQRVPGHAVEVEPEWVYQEIRRNLQYEVKHQLTPECVVPGCTGKGLVVYHAAERGRLANRDWEIGDEIRLCPPHASDVVRASLSHEFDTLPGWLQLDAIPEPDPCDEWRCYLYYRRRSNILDLKETRLSWG